MFKDKNTMKDIITILKSDYRTPGRLLAWGWVAGQWFTIFFVLFMFLHLFGYFPSMFTSDFHSRFQNEDVKLSDSTVNSSLIIKDVAKFLEVSADSINRRQEILESLMRTTEAYMGFALSKENLEQQLKSLSIDLSNCNSSRGRYLKLFSESINPFEEPEIAQKFKKLVGHDRLISRHSIDPQEEKQRWKDLCDLCQNEVNKVNDQLIRILNPQ